MLEQMRRSSQSLLIYLLFGIVIAVFIVNFGPQSPGCDGNQTATSSEAATVDGRSVTSQDFRYGYYSSASPLLMRALAEMDAWIAAIQADTAAGSQHEKVVRNKPATLQEGCNTRDATPAFIAETQQRTAGQ